MDRNASSAVYAGIFISVIGVFALMIMPIVPGVLIEQLGFTQEQATGVISAEVGGGALASVLAMFWIGRLNWRSAILFAIFVLAVGPMAVIIWIARRDLLHKRGFGGTDSVWFDADSVTHPDLDRAKRMF